MKLLLVCFLCALGALSVVATDTFPLPLGTVTGVSAVTCPTGFAAGAVCSQATVSCPNVANIYVKFGVLAGSGSATLGTIVLHGGGGGTTPFNSGYVAPYVNANFDVVQIAWASDWEYAGTQYTKNIKYAACRPATLIRYLYDNVHKVGNQLGFGFHGQSGGSGVGGYILSWYGLGDILDAVEVGAGPVFGDIMQGCMSPAGADVNVCPTGQFGCSQQPGFTVSPTYGGSQCSLATGTSGMGRWIGYDCNCGGTTDQATLTAMKEMSVVSTGANYQWPLTALSQWICKPPTNNSGAQGQFWSAMITPSSGASYLQALVDGCSGAESYWTGTYLGNNAKAASANWMIQNCIPRH